MEGNNLTYPGSRAEWILRRAKEFDAASRNFHCVECGKPAKWVCLDAACVGYNQSKALGLCDLCDARFHIGSSPVMQSHRRLAPVLYVSLLLLHRYRTFLPDTATVRHGEKRSHSPGENDVSSSKRLCPPQARTTDMQPMTEAVTFSSSGYYSPATEMPQQYSPTESNGSSGSTEAGPVRRRKGDSSSGIEYRATFGNNLHPIHARYARILQHLREDSTLTMTDAFRRESFAKLTVKNYLGIAELKLAAPDEFEAVLEAYKSRGKTMITVSGLERECRQVLARRSHDIAQMRRLGQLLPFFDITYQSGIGSDV
ncbi:hypothetical protein Bbelb_356010 [Branchiostoma belcheri]|nr:hypothetical protein Bbelb_356010 [Branchiostoma belcheri]